MEVIKCQSKLELINHAKRLNMYDKINDNGFSVSFHIYDNKGNTIESYIYYYTL